MANLINFCKAILVLFISLIAGTIALAQSNLGFKNICEPQEALHNDSLFWFEDFSSDLENWQGELERFMLDEEGLISSGEKTKDTLFVFRELSFGNNLALNQASFYEKIKEVGLSFKARFSTNFNPSSTNYFRYILYSNTSDIAQIFSKNSDSVDCLYFQMGEKGSKNQWRLFHKKGKETEEILSFDSVYSSSKGSVYDIEFRIEPIDINLSEPNYYTGLCFVYGTASRASGLAAKYMGISFADFNWNEFLQGVEGGSDDEPVAPDVPDAPHEDGEEEPTEPTEPTPPDEDPTEPDDESIEDEPSTPGSEKEDFSKENLEIPNSTNLKFSEFLVEVDELNTRFIEFYNAGDKALVLSNLYVAIEKNTTYKYYRLCKDSLILAPRSYIAFCKDKNKLSATYNICENNIYTASSFPSLENTSNHIFSLYINGKDTTEIEEALYSKDFHHPLLSSTKNISLERINFEAAATEAFSWQSAAESQGGASPGCSNTQYYSNDQNREESEFGQYFSLSSQILSPNNDGLNDNIIIRCNPNLSTWVAKIEVFDSYGRLCKLLTEDEIISPNSFWLYNAVDFNDKLLREGVHIFLITILNPETSKLKRLRYAFAVANI